MTAIVLVFLLVFNMISMEGYVVALSTYIVFDLVIIPLLVDKITFIEWNDYDE